MGKQPRGHRIPLLSVPDEPEPPKYAILSRRIREAVLEGALQPGMRLPSARTLAREEGVSRNTVEAAFRQLRAEGFVIRRVGSGSWISDRLPERPSRPAGSGRAVVGPGGEARGEGSAAAALSARGRSLASVATDDLVEPGFRFAPCVPGLEALPFEAWNRMAARLARRASASLLVPPPVAGVLTLRKAIAEYLSLGRGVRCTAEQVVIVSGTQQALDLVGRLLIDPGDVVWFEDPGYRSARYAFAVSGARLVPVPVDDEGIDVATGIERAPDARLAYVTPSHQYPLGVTLSLARRLALIGWAERVGSWIVEDDYDSELRYDGRQHAAVQSLDRAGRVIYIGTFNKILFPTLRLAYVVVPPELVEPFARARQLVDGFPPPLTQRVLARFIQDGDFAVHLRRIRALYRERRDRFLAAAGDHLPEWVRLGPAATGMHVALHLPEAVDDRAISAEARRRGTAAPPLSAHCLGPRRSGLLVHYGNAPLHDIDDGTRLVGEILAGAPEGAVAGAPTRLRNGRVSGL